MESKIVIMHETSSSTWGISADELKRCLAVLAKGDVIAGGGNKEALFVRTGISPALAASAACPASRVFSAACA